MAQKKYDPTSAEVALTFVGEEVGAAGAPARDLTEADIARLTYERQSSEMAAEGKRPDKRDPDPKVSGQIVRDLTATGRYRARSRPKAKKAKAPARTAPRSSEKPDSAAPAAEPEG
jgi:hypothetical protein